MSHPITLVTAFYMLDKSKNSLETYLGWLQNFLKIQTPVILFSDERTIQRLFTKLPDHIHLVKRELSQFLVAKYDWAAQYLLDHEGYHSKELYMIWNEKSNFVRQGIELNPFGSDYFYWADMGGFRYQDMTPYIHWPNPKVCEAIGNKLVLLNVGKFQANELKQPFPNFQYADRIGGGYFGGPKDVCLWWAQAYYDMLETFFQRNRFAGKDQSIMATVYIHNKNRIHLVEPRNVVTLNDRWFYLHPYLQGLAKRQL